MKIYSFILLLAILAFASCSTTYQTTDAVYYSPTEEHQSGLVTTSQNDQYAVANDSEGGNYVIYNDDYDNNDYVEGYNDGYYSRRINMFDRPGGLFSYNYYMMNSPWYGSPYFGSSFAFSRFGGFGNPYMWSPGFRLGLSWGMPYAYGGLYNSWYSPYYSYNPYYPYHGGFGGYYPGYYYGGGGKYLTTSPRPAVSYGPRRSVGSRAAHTTGSAGVSRSNPNTATAPRRVFRTNSDESVQGANNNTGVRRTFKPAEGERTTQNNGSNRTTTTQARRRIFKSRSDEQPTRVDRNTRTRITRPTEQRSIRREQPRTIERPTIRRTTTPTRTYSSPSPSVRTSSPARTSSPRRR